MQRMNPPDTSALRDPLCRTELTLLGLRKAWLTLSLCLLLPSCASMQRERGHEDVARIVKGRTGYATGWAEGPPEAKGIADRVATLLRAGLTREHAVEIALVHNPRLQATYDDLDI